MRKFVLISLPAIIAAFVALYSSAVASASNQKSCSPDGGAHVATADLHLTTSAIYGYSINYHTNSGWALGTHNNEFTFKSQLMEPWWASPDSGSADTWINRDAMTDLNRPQQLFDIQAIFDHPNSSDPSCDMSWSNL